MDAAGSSGELHWQGGTWEFWSGSLVRGEELWSVTLVGRGLGVLEWYTGRGWGVPESYIDREGAGSSGMVHR